MGRWVHTEDAFAGEVVFWHRARRERARPTTKPVPDVYHFAGLEVWEQAWGQRPAECTAVGQLIFQKRLLGDGGGPPQGKDEEGIPVWASRAWWFGTGLGGGLLAEGCFTGGCALAEESSHNGPCPGDTGLRQVGGLGTGRGGVSRWRFHRQTIDIPGTPGARTD